MDAGLSGVYFYCRSILAKQPFQTGVDNLKVVYDKIAKQSSVPRPGLSRSDLRGGGGRGGAIGAILGSFLRLQGVLFQFSLKEVALGDKVLGASGSQADPGLTPREGEHAASIGEFQYSLGPSDTPGHDAQTPSSEIAAAIADYTTALSKTTAYLYDTMPELLEGLVSLVTHQQAGVSEEMFLRLLGISLFSVHFSAVETARRMALRGVADGTPPHCGHGDGHFPRTNAEALALTFLFNLVNRYAQY